MVLDDGSEFLGPVVVGGAVAVEAVAAATRSQEGHMVRVVAGSCM